MRYLPALDELFHSDSVIFLLIGLVFTVPIAVRIDSRKNLVGIIISVIIYGTCEMASNVHTSYLLEIILLFVGTIAIGSVLGFLIGFIISKIRKL